MATLEKLQALLCLPPNYYGKDLAPVIWCKDGAKLSVQASATHYCTPRFDFGPYTEVEVWCANVLVTEFEYSDSEPSAYVPIELVVEFIDNHGGF